MKAVGSIGRRTSTSALFKGRRDTDYDKGRGILLKDLICIANGAGEQYGYVVYGVKDEGTARIVTGISRCWDDADFQTWASNAFDPVPKFVYRELRWRGVNTVGVFEIERIPGYPHIVIRNIGGVLFEGQVWFRQGSQNHIADRAQLERMILGETPFIVSSTEDPVILRAFEAHLEQLCWSRVEKKDSRLASGYRIAYLPGTRREVWVYSRGRAELIAMLKPNG